MNAHAKPQLSIDFARGMDPRDVGIQRAVDHANRVESEWSGQALGQLRAFVAEQDYRTPFLIEDARAWAERHGLPNPPDARSWGAVTKRAANKKQPIIVPLLTLGGDKITRNGSINKSPKPLWVRAVPYGRVGHGRHDSGAE